jgi:hypothetical protein
MSYREERARNLLREIGMSGSLIDECIPLPDTYPEAVGKQLDVPILHRSESIYKTRVTPYQFFAFIDDQRYFSQDKDMQSAEAKELATLEGYFHRGVSDDALFRVMKRMCAQLPLDPVWVDVDVTKTVMRTTGHEGRHRSMAAWVLGIEEIPIYIIVSVRNREGFPRITEKSGLTSEQKNLLARFLLVNRIKLPEELK